MSENSARELRSTFTEEGVIELSIVTQARPVPGDDEVLLCRATVTGLNNEEKLLGHRR